MIYYKNKTYSLMYVFGMFCLFDNVNEVTIKIMK